MRGSDHPVPPPGVSLEGGGSSQLDPRTAVVVHVSMAVREEISAENREIAMTGIIARVADRYI